MNFIQLFLKLIWEKNRHRAYVNAAVSKRQVKYQKTQYGREEQKKKKDSSRLLEHGTYYTHVWTKIKKISKTIKDYEKDFLKYVVFITNC